jgi:hypothetical protein
MRLPRLLLAGVAVLAAAALAAPPRLRAEEAPPPTRLSDLAWLEGHWRSGGEDAFDEVWLPADGGSMAAVSRLVHGGKANLYELSTIEESPEGLALRIRHFGPGLSPWKSEEGGTPTWRLARTGRSEAVFEDAARDFPRTIAYRRESGDAGDVLVARLEGTAQGKPRTMEFRLDRVTSAGR